MTETKPARKQPGAESLAKIRESLADADAPATRRALASDARDFSAWCRENDCDPAVPVEPTHVAAYLLALEDRGLASSTIARRLATLGRVHRLAGLTAPASVPVVRETMRAIRRRGSSRGTKTARPFTVSMIRAAAPKLALRDRAIVLVGFAAALRRSEIAGLTWGQIEPSASGRIIRLGRTKTDQAPTRGGAVVAIHRGDGGLCSPVAALAAWEQRNPERTPSDLVFGLTSKSIGRVVKRAAQLAGEDPAAYSAHSLRAGFCSEADRAGVNMATWMALSRHKSTDVARGYVRDADADRSPAAAAIARLLAGG